MSQESRAYTLADVEGQAYWFAGALMILKASGEQTEGRFALLDQWVPGGVRRPLAHSPSRGRGVVPPRRRGDVLLWTAAVPGTRGLVGLLAERCSPCLRVWTVRWAAANVHCSGRLCRLRSGSRRASARALVAACRSARSRTPRSHRRALRHRDHRAAPCWWVAIGAARGPLARGERGLGQSAAAMNG
ncbi:MAG: hypothetical protein KatS3mg059_0904 [Thermomicrobiales bacterium]|nr:MAG: hypothetical protein KatS3mg059_0904 [Thermomicrobiales bacterium]